MWPQFVTDNIKMKYVLLYIANIICNVLFSVSVHLYNKNVPRH